MSTNSNSPNITSNNNASTSNSAINKIKTLRKKFKKQRKIKKSFRIIHRLKNMNDCLNEVSYVLTKCKINDQWKKLYERFKIEVNNKIESNEFDITNDSSFVNYVKNKFEETDKKLNLCCFLIDVILKYIYKDSKMRRNQIDEITKLKSNTETFIRKLTFEVNTHINEIYNGSSQGSISFNSKTETSNTNSGINENINNSNNQNDQNQLPLPLSLQNNPIEKNNISNTSLPLSDIIETTEKNTVINEKTKNDNNSNTVKIDTCKMIINSLFQLYKFDQNTDILKVIKDKKKKNTNTGANKKTRNKKKNKSN
jgi:hypothetical protein